MNIICIRLGLLDEMFRENVLFFTANGPGNGLHDAPGNDLALDHPADRCAGAAEFVGNGFHGDRFAAFEKLDSDFFKYRTPQHIRSIKKAPKLLSGH